jgi:hypothetical protein
MIDLIQYASKKEMELSLKMPLGTDTTTGKLWYLKKINLFKSMSQEEMMQLAQKVVEKSFRKSRAYRRG